MANQGVYVVSVLITRPDTSSLYLGVRSAVSSSARHPGVLSTLTMRVPESYFDEACKEAGITFGGLPFDGTVLKAANPPLHQIGQAEGFASPAVFLVESLLARKVEVPELLVAGQLQGSLEPLGVAADIVSDPKGGGSDEQTTMLTYRLTLTAGVEVLPAASSSYSRLAWVEGTALRAALDANDALLLLPDADPFEVCIHGLCVRSAADLNAELFST